MRCICKSPQNANEKYNIKYIFCFNKVWMGNAKYVKVKFYFKKVHKGGREGNNFEEKNRIHLLMKTGTI